MKIKHLAFAVGLELPADEAPAQTYGIIAKKRVGKSYAAGVLVEQFDRIGAQFGIIDPVGRHYGLRLAADGKSKGLDVVILGGLRGDIPLDPESGKLVANAFCDTGRSMIFDVSQFSLNARKKFCTAFGEQLWLRQKAEEDPRVMHIVLEEAQLILPQQQYGPEDARMVGIWTEIVRLGGNTGIGVTLITQRPQSVAKEALTQVECMIVLQVNGVPEKKALKEWLTEKDGNIDLLKELPFLPRGTAYVWSPTWLEHFGKHAINSKWTYDSSATPKVGVKRTHAKLPPLDLKELAGQMEAAKKKGEENDPASLKRQVADLKKQLAKAETAPTTCAVSETKTKEVPVIKGKELTRLEALLERAVKTVEPMNDFVHALQSAAHDISKALHPPPVKGSASLERKPPYVKPVVIETIANGFRKIDFAVPAPKNGEVKVQGGALRMLKALAQFPSLTTSQIGMLADMKVSGGSFSTYISLLTVNGLAGKQGKDEYAITEHGRHYLGVEIPDELVNTQEVVDLWKNAPKMSGKAGYLLQKLVDGYPKGRTREECAEIMSMDIGGGSFSTYLSQLRSNDLIVERDGAFVANEEQLFR